MNVGKTQTRKFFKKNDETLMDLAENFLRACKECGNWVGQECLLASGRCLNCHSHCERCGSKLKGFNQETCDNCRTLLLDGESPSKPKSFCSKCGASIKTGTTFCATCGDPVKHVQRQQQQQVNDHKFSQQASSSNITRE